MADGTSATLFEFTDVILVLATFAGGLFAVGLQRWLEKRNEKGKRQAEVFEALMTTRATRLAPRHVEALNSIPIVFYGKGRSLQQIREDWNDYLKLLGDNDFRGRSPEAWAGAQIPKLVAILHAISQHLGFSFTKQEIENGIYAPEGHFAIEAAQRSVLWGMARILEGQGSFPIWVANLHPPASDSFAPKSE